MRKYIPFAFKNSLRNKRRTILTIASISVSLFLLGMLIAIYHAFYFRAAPPEQALRLVMRNRVSLTFSIPEYYEPKSARSQGSKRLFPARGSVVNTSTIGRSISFPDLGQTLSESSRFTLK
jgi:hypothetical protein